MFRSSDVNRFVLDEFKTNNIQQIFQLENKLFSTTAYSSKAPKSICWRFGRWLCCKRVRTAIQSLESIGLIDMDENVENQYILSNLAKTIFSPQVNTQINIDKLLEWTYMVGDKQYFLYSWNDTKVQGLLTVDAALMAGILFILQLLDSATTLKLTSFINQQVDPLESCGRIDFQTGRKLCNRRDLFSFRKCPRKHGILDIFRNLKKNRLS